MMRLNQLARFKTGIEGLDSLFGGGLFTGASYLIQGRPGSGKTILTNQIAFHHARQGGHVIYATLLSESHDRMFGFLSTMDFFDGNLIGSDIEYLSAFDTLSSEGLDAVIKLLRREIIRSKTSLLIVDGLLNARSRAETPLDTKKFIAELQAHAGFVGCTLLFLTGATLDEGSPELTMVDGMILMEEQHLGVRSIRRISVRKSRGSAAIPGEHEYQINHQGVTVYPRLEAYLNTPPLLAKPKAEKICSGVYALDEALSGGLYRSSVSLILGPSGSGKTTLGLNFILQSTADEPGLFFGFYETPDQLTQKAQALDLDLQAAVDAGIVRICWQSTTELQLDSVGYKLLKAVRDSNTKRVFIDSLGAMARSAIEQARLIEFFGALFNELRRMNVTVYGTWEIRGFLSSDISTSSPELCSLADNLFTIHFDERDDEFEGVFSILKLRNSAFDRSRKLITIGAGGVSLVARHKNNEKGKQTSSVPNT